MVARAVESERLGRVLDGRLLFDDPMTKRPKPAKIAAPQGRAVKEWIGKTPDAMPPERVRLRIFDRAKGRCHISGRKIHPGEDWEVEHIVAMADGGENREGNLAPALTDPHKRKSAKEAKERAQARVTRKAHIGIKTPPKHPIESRNELKTEKAPRPESKKATPPRRGGIYARYFGSEE